MKPYYEHGGITIYNADCKKLLLELPQPAAELCFTDPPYNMKHVDGGGFAAARAFYREGALDGLSRFDTRTTQNTITLPNVMSIANCAIAREIS